MTNASTRSLLLASALLTTTALAMLAGCSSKADDPAPSHEMEANATSAAPTATTDGTPAKAPAPAPKSTTPPPSEKDAGAAGDGGGTGDGGGSGGGGGGACLDDKSPAVQPACPTAGAGDECTGACDDYEANFKKGISADIRKCLTKALCQAGTTSTCTDKALAKACADPTATTFCTPNVTGCKGANGADTITQASCEAVAKGLTTAGRAILQGCFETSAVCGDCLATIK